MYFILERTLDTQGGAPPYSYVCRKKTIKECVQEICELKKEDTAGWERDFLITHLIA